MSTSKNKSTFKKSETKPKKEAPKKEAPKKEAPKRVAPQTLGELRKEFLAAVKANPSDAAAFKVRYSKARDDLRKTLKSNK